MERDASIIFSRAFLRGERSGGGGLYSGYPNTPQLPMQSCAPRVCSVCPPALT